jgi:hypothetical protein
MKKFVIAAAIVLSSSFSYAQSKAVEVQKTVYCMATKSFLKYLMEDLKERPIFLGEIEDKKEPITSVAVLYNPLKDTFSVLEFNDTVACLITSGDTVELSLPPSVVGR